MTTSLQTTLVPLQLGGASHPQADVCARCEVRGAALFGALGKPGLDHIREPIESVRLAADSVIFTRGERGAVLYSLRSGVVGFERLTERGDRRIVRLAGCADLIGQEALLGLPYGDTAVARTAVELCRIPKLLVEQLGEREPKLRHELMLRWQHALDDAESWIADLASGPARRRVLRLLQRLGQHADAASRIWLPRREEFGAMLDMSIETASRLVSQLRREGVIELLGGRTARLDGSLLAQALLAEDAP